MLAVFALALVVTAHHAEMPMEMPGMGHSAGMVDVSAVAGGHHDAGTTVAMVACLAALVAIGAGVLAIALGLHRLSWNGEGAGGALAVPRARAVLARARPPGPASLCTWRI